MTAPVPPPAAHTAAPFAALLCLVLAAASHAASVRNRWSLDDVPVVRDNPALVAGGGGVAGLFRVPSWPGDLEQQPWRPLALASLALEIRLWGGPEAPWTAQGIHVLSVLLHAFAAMLLLGLLSRALPGRRAWAVGTALVFAAHPLATGVISSATGRADLLAVFFGLVALHAWLAYDRGRPATLPFAALAFFLALLSKESALGLPAAALLLDRGARGLSLSQALARRWPGYLALAATAALWWLLWPGPGHPGVDLPEPGLGPRLVLGLEAFGRQTLASLLPVGLCADRSAEALAGLGFPLRGGALFTALLAAAGLLLALGFPARGVWGPRLRAVLTVGGTLALVQALTLPLGLNLEDRSAYLLLPALAGLGGLALEALATSAGRLAVAGLAGAGAALLVLGLLSAREAQAWQDDAVVHDRLLARDPTHGPAILRRIRRLAAEAQHEREVASTLRFNDPALESHRSASRTARASALEWAQRAASLTALREGPEVHLLFGQLLLDDDRTAEAETELRRARAAEALLGGGERGRLAAGDPRAVSRARRLYEGLGRAAQGQGRGHAAAAAYEEALRWERRAAELEKREPDAALVQAAGMSLVADGRFADGLPLLAEVASRARDPELRRQAAALYESLSKAALDRLRALLTAARGFEDEHRQKPALDTYLEALRVDPTSVEARERAAFFLKYFGRYPEARALVEEGLRLLDRTPPGAATDRERARLGSLRADIDRWEKESAAEEAADMAGRPR